MTKGDITAVREKLGLTRIDFSRRLGINVASLWNYETGKTKPSNLAKEKLRRAMYFAKSNKPIPHTF